MARDAPLIEPTSEVGFFLHSLTLGRTRSPRPQRALVEPKVGVADAAVVSDQVRTQPLGATGLCRRVGRRQNQRPGRLLIILCDMLAVRVGSPPHVVDRNEIFVVEADEPVDVYVVIRAGFSATSADGAVIDAPP
jgi:hypothetical protein